MRFLLTPEQAEAAHAILDAGKAQMGEEIVVFGQVKPTNAMENLEEAGKLALYLVPFPVAVGTKVKKMLAKELEALKAQPVEKPRPAPVPRPEPPADEYRVQRVPRKPGQGEFRLE